MLNLADQSEPLKSNGDSRRLEAKPWLAVFFLEEGRIGEQLPQASVRLIERYGFDVIESMDLGEIPAARRQSASEICTIIDLGSATALFTLDVLPSLKAPPIDGIANSRVSRAV